MRLPWAEPQARFTTLFERSAIDVLQACDVTGAAPAPQLAGHLLEQAGARGRSARRPRLPKRAGVNEKAVAKGHT